MNRPGLQASDTLLTVEGFEPNPTVRGLIMDAKHGRVGLDGDQIPVFPLRADGPCQQERIAEEYPQLTPPVCSANASPARHTLVTRDRASAT